ncbi:apolipoprotein N-acyltransferase [Jannaschia seohaensis]|uniref:Apolipoprotein N-acyltransferase n=1 Tax=Jannaschia seohaensis TaxID=475081 RepID=A0A2Y9B5C9_9RHOB|nr:apolipoprotein N-acyltransferase [Jannaschia seohaensis]PWJ10346.1 apolipoprotein N-acyltransferase [Jannaschia seohaensis]SSA51746.1 apolipoprotein N-acyltransferase [Jannaschia seohaensis]
MILPRWLTGPLLWALAGAAAALGQAPWGLWPVALAGYGLGLVLIARARVPGLAGWIFGAAHFAVALHWIVEPFFVDAAATGWLAPIALGAISLGLGLFWAMAGAVGARLGGALGVAAALGAAELARAYVLTGFPWAMPGHVLIASPALPSAGILGAHGLGLCLLLGIGLIATWRPALSAFGVALLSAPFALATIGPPTAEAAPDAPVIRLVQPNAPQAQKWDPDFIGIFFRRGLEATAAPKVAPVALTVWPETSLPQLLSYSEDIRPILSNAADGPVLIGAQRYDDDGAPRNAAVLLTGSEGEIAHVYDKHRLVPFGEYLPLPQVAEALGIGPLAAQLAGRYAPGPGPDLIEIPGLGPVLPLICYEAIFPQDIRAADRPRAILHLTNDAWFGQGAGPRQHLALARLRAAESGLPVLRAANTGISAVIDARGGLIATLGLNEVGHLDALLPPAAAPTPYVRIGDWPALALILTVLATLAIRKRARAVDAGNVRA